MVRQEHSFTIGEIIDFQPIEKSVWRILKALKIDFHMARLHDFLGYTQRTHLSERYFIGHDC